MQAYQRVKTLLRFGSAQAFIQIIRDLLYVIR